MIFCSRRLASLIAGMISLITFSCGVCRQIVDLWTLELCPHTFQTQIHLHGFPKTIFSKGSLRSFEGLLSAASWTWVLQNSGWKRMSTPYVHVLGRGVSFCFGSLTGSRSCTTARLHGCSYGDCFVEEGAFFYDLGSILLCVATECGSL